MPQWELVDCLEPLQEDESNPRIPVTSETHLREELNRFRHRKPSAVHLDSPDRETLILSIGGPFAGLAWYPPVSEERDRGYKAAMPERVVAPSAADFVGEGIPTTLEPKELLPVEDVIEAVVYFYKNHHLPEWITWREWNPVTLSWATHAANGAPRSVPTAAVTPK
jgi:hypothetical protein